MLTMATHVEPTDSLDPRRAAILGAAFDTFCQYGFRRTTMEDIARAALQSRAALYLHYPNKQAIYRALVQHYFDVTEARMRAALVPGLDPVQALEGAIAAKAGPEVAAMLASQHGDELLNANEVAAADVVRAGELRIVAVLADWLAAEGRAGRIRLDEPAQATAQMLVGALAGLRSGGAGFDAYSSGAARLARMVGRALRP